MTEGWTKMADGMPPDDALIIYYVPIARYIWGCGLDYQQIKAEYPAVTHWKMCTMQPIEPEPK